MTVVRQCIDKTERVYAVSFSGEPIPKKAFMASEGFGTCTVFDFAASRGREVLDNPGGTTDICPHPEDDRVFFAITNFLPVFKSQEAQLAFAKEEADGEWRMHAIKTLPFLHRIDIIAREGKLLFIGAILCGSKKDTDDWSDPGRILVGEIDQDSFELTRLSVVLDGLTRNHGFGKTGFNGEESYLITGDTGVWVMPIPKVLADGWHPRKLLDFPVSDMAVCDIDSDGSQEFGFISPFHGNAFSIQKYNGTIYEPVYAREIDFGHVLWGGLVNGIPSFILGYRQGDQKLLLIRCVDGERYTETVIDAACGPSQIACVQGLNCFHILSANRKTGNVLGEAVLYTLFEDGLVSK